MSEDHEPDWSEKAHDAVGQWLSSNLPKMVTFDGNGLTWEMVEELLTSLQMIQPAIEVNFGGGSDGSGIKISIFQGEDEWQQVHPDWNRRSLSSALISGNELCTAGMHPLELAVAMDNDRKAIAQTHRELCEWLEKNAPNLDELLLADKK